MIKRRHVYHQPHLTDLSVFKAEAERRARGDSRQKPTPTTIHHHKVFEPCNEKCETVEVAE